MRRELTRGKFRRKISSGMLPLMAGCLMLSLAILWPLALWFLQDKKDPPAEVVETAYEEGRLPGGEEGRLPGDDIPATEKCYLPEEEVEQAENEMIVAALLERAHRIDNCTVTWYTADTCGKEPGDPAYGITASGLPVVEHLTCAVDPDVIPRYADVFVQYADGTIEQLWATDTGVQGNHIDIYTPDYDYAIQCGRQKLTVWWVSEEE